MTTEEPPASERACTDTQQEFWSDPCWANPDDDYRSAIPIESRLQPGA